MSWRDSTITALVSVCHHGSYAETYSRCIGCAILLARELEPKTVVRPCHSCHLDDFANDLGVERENNLVFDHGQQPGVLLLLVITIDRGFFDQPLETLGIGSKRPAGHETLLMQVPGA